MLFPDPVTPITAMTMSSLLQNVSIRVSIEAPAVETDERDDAFLVPDGASTNSSVLLLPTPGEDQDSRRTGSFIVVSVGTSGEALSLE